MADAASLLARLKAARSTARMIDPATGDPRDVAIDAAFAAGTRPDTVWVPIVANIGTRIARQLTLRDEDAVAIDNTISTMIADCAVTPIGDDVLAHVRKHIADRGFTLVPETRR